MTARLRVLHSRANVQVIPLLAETVIGRSPECQLKIASTEVSRKHCRVSVCADGVYVEDLDSANGTLLDGSPIPKKTPTFAAVGATLQIGPAKFAIEYTPRSAEAQPFFFDDAAALESRTVQADETQFVEAVPDFALESCETNPKETAKPKSLFALWGRKAKPASTADAAPSAIPSPAIPETLPEETTSEETPQFNFGESLFATEHDEPAPATAANPLLDFLKQS